RTVTINVVKASPLLTWVNPADVSDGTALSSAQLNAIASVPGTFLYTPGAGTILRAGSAQVLSVAFTPNDTINYASVTKEVSIDVTIGGKRVPIITRPGAANIAYGTALSGAQLNATANVPGIFVYTPPIGT